MDLFDKLLKNRGPLGQYAKEVYGYFMFPKLTGDISNRMIFQGKERLVWSLNNYLGLANHPQVRKADAEAAANFGYSTPMGARILTGNSDYIEELERELADFVGKEDAILLNFGFQGMVTSIDAILARQDVVIYDAESHACIMDGVRLHLGKRFSYPHNDIQHLEKQLEKATRVVAETGGGILVITEGVFGMRGDMGNLKEIVALKNKYKFRLFVDDAHGIGTMGKTGAGTGEEQGVQDGIDLYFGTFAKSFALIGGFIAGDEEIIEYLKYNSRSQIFAKSLPIPLVQGIRKRLELIRTQPELRENLWKIVRALQRGLVQAGFNIGNTVTPVTPVYLQGSPEEASSITVDLRENYNIFCSIVIYPMVPKGIIILRLIPTATHTLEDVEYTIKAFSEVNARLKAGKYQKEKIVRSL